MTTPWTLTRPAIEPAVTHVALEGMPLTMRWYFDPVGHTLAGATVVPGILRDFGDVKDVLAEIAPRKVMMAASVGTLADPLPGVESVAGAFSTAPALLIRWLTK